MARLHLEGLKMRCGLALGAIVALGFLPAASQDGRRLRVGITLHPYYSWVANIVGKAPVDVVPILDAGAEVHNYQPSPDDLKKLAGLDAIVVNGLGHDDFIKGMIEASGNKKVRVINPNASVPLIPYARGKSHSHGDEKGAEKEAPKKTVAYNPHTFLALTNAVQQVYALEKELSALAPAHAETFRENARGYARRLRELKADASGRLAQAAVTKVATVHDGYSYFLQEFGIEIVGVIEPAHGVEPSANELQKTIEAIKATKVGVILSELTFPEKLVAIIRKETGARIYSFDHMAKAERYSSDRFETAMRANVDTLVRALVTEAKGP